MKMEHLTRTLCAAMAAAAMTAAVSCSRTAEADYDIVPAPLEVTAAEGEPFLLKNGTAIIYPAGAMPASLPNISASRRALSSLPPRAAPKALP